MEWHAAHSSEILRLLDSSVHGLREEDAKTRLSKFGPNSIEIKAKISPITIFLNQFKNLLVLLLLAAALVSLGISLLRPDEADIFDALLIFLIVVANAAFGFFQEYKAEKSIEALGRMSAPKASVLRNSREMDIPSSEVVPGDILILNEGDKVAADARVLESFSLYSDESMLSGESVPSLKKDVLLRENTPLADRVNMVYMNSVITRGRGSAVVVQTGLDSEVGRIAKEISEAPEKITQFQVEIEDIGKKVSILTIAILIIIALTEFLLRTGDILFIFIAAVALGVAAIPEGLPAVVTLALSMATSRMLNQGALTRRLSTVQDLGSVDVICTDKTGTLTENVMTVTRISVPEMAINVIGKGHDLGEHVSKIEQNPDLKGKRLELLLRCAYLCNNSKIIQEKGRNFFKGDPTEVAVMIPGYKAGIDVDAERIAYKRLDEIPFSAERKLMSTINSPDPLKMKGIGGADRYSFVKGAPEILLERCDRILYQGKTRKITKEDKETALMQNRSMAQDALRVLGFAYKENPKSSTELDAENGLVYLGLMGMIDPPREGVKSAIDDCRRAGIRIIMITGDNKYTAQAIGKELGFKGKVVTGDEIDELDDRSLGKVVEETDIYARTSPKHKVMILKALQRDRHVVCMTGDGVNDAAAIKNSDVGVSMGIRGTEVTKQASDMIILDDNFITIRNAVLEGRGTFDNIRKFVVYLLGANISEVFIVFLATILGLGISAKIAVQLLWINLVTDGLPALAIGVDPPESEIMQRKPRKKDERVVNQHTLFTILSIGFCGTAALLAIYSYMINSAGSLKAQAVLFTAFVLMEMLTVYIVRWRYGAKLFSNPWLHLAVASSILLQLVITYTPLNTYFGIVPLGMNEMEVVAAGIALFLGLLLIPFSLERIFGKRGVKHIPLD